MSTGPEELNLETIAPGDADLIDLRYEGVDLPLDENADPTQVELACGEYLGVVALEGGYDDESFVDLHVLGEVFRGESAYDAAVRNGFVGTLSEWLESLRGPESPNADEARAAQAAAEAAADRAEAATLGASASETSAEGHASAASTARGQAEAYSDSAGAHAQASLDFQTQAETSAGEALAYRNQAAQSSTDADSAAARAETAEGVSVTMRNQAQGFSEASAASSQSAETYMDESRVEAQAARDAHLLAETSRENSLAHSQASYDSAQEALARSTEAGEYASAALTSRLAAEAARDDTDLAAAAVIVDRDIVIARADEAGEYAEAAESHRASALTSAGAASVSAENSAISEINADSSRVAAEAARDIAVSSSGDAADALAATISYRDQAEIFSDQSGDYATAAAYSATSASTSSTAAGTSATGAGASAAASLASANAAATSASSALTQAGAALTSANNAATSATTSTNQATNSATSATAAAASQAAAALSESAAISAEADAIIAQGAAQTAAANAATQATAAALSATNALSSANSAATSATQSSSSATTAAGHASNASISSGAAATSATNAANSSTAASGSASTAATHATNAGNSATSANASSVSAASSFNSANILAAMQLPDRYDGSSGQFFTSGAVGSPVTRADLPSNATASGFGPVREAVVTTGSNNVVAPRGVIPAIPGRIYKVEIEFQRTGITGTADAATLARIELRSLDSAYADTAGSGSGLALVPFTGDVQTSSVLISNVASAGVTAWPAGAVWLRPYFRTYAGTATSITTQFRRITITDVTEQQAALVSANAAATSASSASTSAGAAGSSATAANTSATNAATSAGAASTSATNASNSATTASGHAATATTQAGLAATSAGLANGSATAANTSAGNAATSATNAGNSATAANTSAINAASSFTASNLLASMQLPDRYDGTSGQYFTASVAGAPSSLSDLPSNATAAGYGPIREVTINNSDFATRGVIPAIPGRIYKIEFEYQKTASTGTSSAGSLVWPSVRCLDSSYANTATVAQGISVSGFTGGVQTASFLVSDVASPGVLSWGAGASWLRPYIRIAFGTLTSLTVQIRRVTVTDVTEQQAAANSATAAATSASSASTSASAAGSSATSASTSATNAATSAGAASTSATNASNSATTAAGSASTATTQAGLAATSAGLASGSATASNTSAGAAATSATNAGNSATAANTSSVNAASSYTATRLTAANQLPFDFSQDGAMWSASYSGAPAALTPIAASGVYSFPTVSGVGKVIQIATAGTNRDVAGIGTIPLVSGRTYRITGDVRVLSTVTGSPTCTLYFIGMNSAGSAVTTPGISSSTLVANTWTKITQNYSAYALVALNATTTQVRVLLRANGASGSNTFQFREVRLEDVTDQLAAAASASAAATSASSAGTSATNAGTSATAAATSATNASTSAGTAGTSATNAANSATTATTQANNAATSASTAATHATNAGNSASAAGTSATTAGTYATNAGNSATAASASAVSAASSFTNTVLVGGNQFFDNGPTGWFYSSGTVTVGAKGGRSSVFHSTASATMFGLKKFPFNPTRKYKITLAYYTGAGTGSSQIYGGFVAYDAAGNQLTHNPGSYAYVAAAGAMQAANAGWVEYTSPVIAPQVPGALYGYPAGTASIALMALPNYNTSNIDWGIDFIRLDDVTEQEAAATSATAAATSASAASTSAGAAGVSASSAATQATNAGVSAGNAASSASTAATQASNASASASSASASATLSATVANRSLMQGAAFTANSTNGVPPGWNAWTNGHLAISATGEAGGYALRLPGGAGSEGGIYQDTAVNTILGSGYYVLEAKVRLDAGTLVGAMLLGYGADNSMNWQEYSLGMYFPTFPDVNGNVIGNGVVGRTYSFSKLVQVNANTRRIRLYAMSHYSGYGSIASANELTWFLASVRPATPAEIAAGVALPALSATVSSHSASLVDLNANYALARWEVAADTGGGTARIRLTSTTYGTDVLLDADNIKFGDNTVFDNAVDVLVTTTGSNSRIIAWGAAFGTEGQLTEWEGPSSVTWGNHSRANAYFYRANVAPYVGGSALASGFTVTSSHTSRVGTRVGAGSVTSGTVTLTPTGAFGSVTYLWSRIYGDSSITATSGSAEATAFTTTVSAGQEKQAIFAWTATDEAGKVQTGTVGVGLIGNS